MSERQPGGRIHRFEARESTKTPEKGGHERFEHQPALNPHDILAKTLEGETRGSMKVQAIADAIALEAAESRFEKLKAEKSPNIGELIEVGTKKAAIEETIRIKKFGEDATEYKNAAVSGSRAWEAYVNQRTQQVGHYSLLVKAEAAERLLEDLETINAQLPKKGETPIRV